MRVFAAFRPPAAALDHVQRAVDAAVPPWRGAGPAPLRWTDAKQRHITLAFYGEVPDGAIPELTSRLAAVARRWPLLHLQLVGAGLFAGTTLWVGVRGTARPAQQSVDIDQLPVDAPSQLLTDVVLGSADAAPSTADIVPPTGDAGLGAPVASQPRGDETCGDITRLMARCEEAGCGISRVGPRDRRRAHLTLARAARRGGRSRERVVNLDDVVHALAVYRGPAWQASHVELIASMLGEGNGGGPRHQLIARLPLAG